MAKFNHTAHKELWDWLVRNPDKQKSDWEGWNFNGGKYEGIAWGCFACKYDNCNGCKYCPLVWPNDMICSKASEFERSLFQDWDNETDLKKRSELARQIRDLPVREGVECE